MGRESCGVGMESCGVGRESRGEAGELALQAEILQAREVREKK